MQNTLSWQRFSISWLFVIFFSPPLTRNISAEIEVKLVWLLSSVYTIANTGFDIISILLLFYLQRFIMLCDRNIQICIAYSEHSVLVTSLLCGCSIFYIFAWTLLPAVASISFHTVFPVLIAFDAHFLLLKRFDALIVQFDLGTLYADQCLRTAVTETKKNWSRKEKPHNAMVWCCATNQFMDVEGKMILFWWLAFVHSLWNLT